MERSLSKKKIVWIFQCNSTISPWYPHGTINIVNRLTPSLSSFIIIINYCKIIEMIHTFRFWWMTFCVYNGLSRHRFDVTYNLWYNVSFRLASCSTRSFNNSTLKLYYTEIYTFFCSSLAWHLLYDALKDTYFRKKSSFSSFQYGEFSRNGNAITWGAIWLTVAMLWEYLCLFYRQHLVLFPYLCFLVRIMLS